MTLPRLRPIVPMLLALLALAAIALSLLKLHTAETGVAIEPTVIGETPATIFRPKDEALGPVVVIAHGFAGSQQLMQSFALAFARNGYVAVTFDFLGHGRNPAPLAGSITEEQGATRALVEETAEVAAHARTLGDGRLAVLGHSMASDIVVRFAEARPDVAATIAVSMFSPVVTADEPRNLLIIVGEWEGMLKREALRVVALSTAPAAAAPGVTYGDPSTGTARRAAFSPAVEHASVLFSQASLREALGWLDAVFAVERQEPPMIAGRGPWIMLLIAGCTLLARQLAPMLPRLAEPPAGAGLRWRRLWPALLVPAIATPLLLRVLPTHFLPVLVGDYLAMHFLVYGLLTALCLRWLRRGDGQRFAASVASPATIFAALAVAGPKVRLTVSELVPAIVTWARGPMADLFDGCLDDPRVSISQGDIGELIAAKKEAFDAILLDVDNGPEGLTRRENDRLYDTKGLARTYAALRPGGVLAVWSSGPDSSFTTRLQRTGFAVEEVKVRARQTKRGARHVIWLATRP